PTSSEQTGESGDLSIEMPDGQTITLTRHDVELGTRITDWPREGPIPAPPIGEEGDEDPDDDVPDDDGEDGGDVTLRDQAQQAARFEPRIRAMDRTLDVRLRGIDLARPAAPPVRRLTFTLETGAFRLSQAGGLEIPVYVVARRLLADGKKVAATVAADTELLVEAASFEARRVRIEKGRTRSTELVYLPLRRQGPLRVTASRLDGEGEPATLDLDWSELGPGSLALEARPAIAESYATGLSPIILSVHLESDGRRLRPGLEVPILVEQPGGLEFEPQEVALPADGTPARLEVRGYEALEQTLVFSAPDLDLEARVEVRFQPPWTFLAIAGLLGLVGVLVARRAHLLEQSRSALVLELLTAATGGALLYTAFLFEWLPSPGFLLGELPAGAVGIIGGYLGEGVFQLLTRTLNLGKSDAGAEDDGDGGGDGD
ncbi:MAG: hypothetical protein AAFX50_19910, partial [Acidobacteriota bacterium]